MNRKFMIVLSVSAAMLPTTVFQPAAMAESGLDAFKVIAEGAKVIQEKMKHPSEKTEGESSPSIIDGSSSNSGGTSGAKLPSSADKVSTPGGLDILGIRLGMTATDVQAVFRKRGMRYGIGRSELQYQKLGGAYAPIPNTGYVSRIDALGTNQGDIRVYFVPDGRQERAYSIARKHALPANQRPTIDAYLNTLKEKFGPPSLDSSNDGSKGVGGIKGWMWWFFDGKGKLVVPKDISKHDCHSSVNDDGQLFFEPRVLPNPGSAVSRCGSTYVRARTTSGNNQVISIMENNLVSFEDYAKAMEAVENKIVVFQKSQMGKEIGAAGKRKPEL